MTIFHNDRQSTQEIKKYLKPHTLNKISEPNVKLEKSPTRTLPVRGNPLKK